MNQEILEFSHRSIIFQKQKPFVLQLTNKSKNLSVLFKIKTTKLNTYQVKPPLGSIQPGEKKTIEFKLVKPLTQQQLNEAKTKDKFQFQCITVNPNNVPKSKPQYKNIWDQVKNDPTKQASIFNFTVPLLNENQANLLTCVRSEPFSPIKLKTGTSKSQSKIAVTKKLFTLQKDPKKDEQLSKEFEMLKQKQEQLIQERQKIFKSQQKITPSSNKSGAKMVLLVIAFLISIMIGNFLKLRVFMEPEL